MNGKDYLCRAPLYFIQKEITFCITIQQKMSCRRYVYRFVFFIRFSVVVWKLHTTTNKIHIAPSLDVYFDMNLF